jgi:metallo-beta-lactamase family protein
VRTIEIQSVEQDHGTLLIPAFSVERSQEILHIIDHLKKDKRVKEETRVFLDSTLSVHVTRVYQHYKSLYNKELQQHALVDDPFEFPGLTMIESPKESRNLAATPGPKVVIAGSGMMNGGRTSFPCGCQMRGSAAADGSGAGGVALAYW